MIEHVLMIHRKIVRISLFLLASFFAVDIEAQWIKTNGPESGEVECVTRVGTEIWAGTTNGIYITSNEGDFWHRHQSYNQGYFTDIVNDGDTIIIRKGGVLSDTACSILRSFDGGNSWSTITTAAILSNFRLSGNVLLASTGWEYGVFYSNDYGSSWNEYISPYDTTVYESITQTGSILKCRDAGISYFYLFNNSDFTSTLVGDTDDFKWMDLEGTVLYAQTIPQGNISAIKRSSDLGATWQTVYTFAGIAGSKILNRNDTLFFNHHYNTFWPDTIVYSVNSGLSWSVTDPEPMIWAYSYSPTGVILNSGDYLYGNSLGFHTVLSPASTQGPPKNNGFYGITIRSLYSINNTLYAATGDASTFRSADEGQTWTEIPSITYYTQDMCLYGDSILDLIGFSGSNIALGVSADNGLTWTHTGLPFPGSYYFRAEIEQLNGKLYLHNGDTLYVSDDFGTSWTSILVVGNAPNNYNHLVRKGELIYVLNSATGNYYILNGIDPPQPVTIDGATSLNCFSVIGNTLIASGFNELFWSDDGITWTSSAMNGLPFNVYYAVPSMISGNDSLWFGRVGNEIFLSSNKGNNWNNVSGPAGESLTGSLVLQNDKLFTGTIYSSVWRRDGGFIPVQGTVYRDFDGNGVMDGADYTLQGVSVKTEPSGFTGSSNSDGHYSLFAGFSQDSVMVVPPVSYTTVLPSFYLANSVAASNDFGLYISPEVMDLNIDITNNTVFRPGFNTNVTITAGSYGASAPVTVKVLKDPELSFVSAVPMNTSQDGDTLIWQLPELDFCQSSVVNVIFHTNQSSALGTPVFNQVWVNIPDGDLTPDNNYDSLFSSLVGSFDPNDKTCIQGETFTPDQLASGEELEFVIRFQNTGSYQADNVHISDTLISSLDLNSFRIISSSHPLRYELQANGIADFIFEDIFLPDSSSNEPASHGFVKYGIKASPLLQLGDGITNTAYIYFDFNEPVITNTTNTVIGYPIILTIERKLGLPAENTIIVYPNPATNYVTVDTRGLNEAKLKLFLYDARGSLVKTVELSSASQELSLEGMSSGVYFGVIFNGENKRLGKFTISNP